MGKLRGKQDKHTDPELKGQRHSQDWDSGSCGLIKSQLPPKSRYPEHPKLREQNNIQVTNRRLGAQEETVLSARVRPGFRVARAPV